MVANCTSNNFQRMTRNHIESNYRKCIQHTCWICILCVCVTIFFSIVVLVFIFIRHTPLILFDVGVFRHFFLFFCLLCIFFIHLKGFWNAENDFVASIELSSKYTNCQQCINSFACPHHCAQCIYTDKEI